jgi:hypothetical protein
MPATIPPNIMLRREFAVVVGEAHGLNELLERIIAIKSWTPSGGEFHGKVSHSPPPWNSNAANAIFDLHAWSRQTEAQMRILLDLPMRYRGGSSTNTKAALDSLVRLSEAANDRTVKDNRVWLNGWCKKSEIILGKEEAAKRLPREQGQPEPACPWCKQTTLRSYAVRGEVFCIDPTCRDEEGRRPHAMLEYLHGDLGLRWQDGIMS